MKKLLVFVFVSVLSIGYADEGQAGKSFRRNLGVQSSAGARNKPRTFRYATWNIGHFALGRNYVSAITAAAAPAKRAAYGQFLDQVGADWFGVNEYSGDFTRDGSVAAAEAVFGRYPVQVVGPQNGYQWNAAFASSRFKVLEKVVKFYGIPPKTAVHYYVANRVRIDDAYEAWFVQTHLEFGFYEQKHRAEVDQLIRDFADKPRVVISGDFNNFVHRRGGKGYETGWGTPGLFQAAGYCALNQGALGLGDTTVTSHLSVDNIFARGFQIDAGTIVDATGLSDHHAVACRLTPMDDEKPATNAAVVVNAEYAKATNVVEWQEVWRDEFRGDKLDETNWSYIDSSYAQKPYPVDPRKTYWNAHISGDPIVYKFTGETLKLLCVKNPDRKKDPRPYLCGGIFSRNKRTLQYGKVEVRFRLKGAKGTWPAIWMMPNSPGRSETLPNGDWGEMDLMERISYDPFVYQTTHTSHSRYYKKTFPPKHTTAPIDPNGWNTVGVEWHPDRLVYTTNGKPTIVWPKLVPEQKGQWTFDYPFYLLIDMQVGGMGSIDPETLNEPAEMEIDWVSFSKPVSR